MRCSSLLPILAIAAVGGLAGCDDRPRQNEGPVLNEQVIEGDGRTEITAEIWVDNWFALAINGEPLVEDSVAFRTERSFNAERVTFTADFPMTIAFEFRDFMENDTGLEYIGSSRQQIGDGGAIAQFRNAATGKLVAVTDSSWRCKVIHRAPLDAACADEAAPAVGEGSCRADISAPPTGWTAADFDGEAWDPAVEHEASEVRPKDGYDAIDWVPEAKLIWSADLELDNIVLCRTTVESP